jgi:hypothetical protein
MGRLDGASTRRIEATTMIMAEPMTVAELIAELQTKDPAALVVMEYEHKGWWSLDTINGIQDKWVTRSGPLDYDTVDEGTSGAVKAVRIW